MAERQLAPRPAVEDLAFSLFDIPLHPELAVAAKTREFRRDGAVLRIGLAAGGHFLSWRRGPAALTETLGGQDLLLPSTRQLFTHRVGGERVERHEPAVGLRYEACFQLERLPPELFCRLHDEICRDGARDGILHVFPSHDRLDLPPVSYVDLHARPGSMIVHAFHTFPESFGIVKTQTLIDYPR